MKIILTDVPSFITSNLLIVNNNDLNNVCFSDASSFYLNRHLIRLNCRYWSDVNPHWYRQTHSHIRQKQNFWADILEGLVGPYFINGNVNGKTYLDLRDTTVNPRLTQLLEMMIFYLKVRSPFNKMELLHLFAPVRQSVDQ